MLVGIDGSDQSKKALAWALSHAAARGGSVEAIMTVSPAGGSVEQAVRDSQQTLGSIVAEAVDGMDSPPPVSYEVVVGDPAVVLVNASRAADMVVLGSHGRSRLDNPALGSVSLACIRLGSCPVLVIPTGESADESG